MADKTKKVRLEISAKNRTKKGFNDVRTGLRGIERAAGAVGLSLGAIGLAQMATTLVDINAKYQKLEASLITVTGSQQAANAAFANLQDFTRRTPYLLDEVVAGFVKMKALGLDPSNEALTSFGNTASAMGLSLNQMVEAVADAATGEFERLKEFGIKAKSQGDNVTFIFQGVSTTIKKEAGAIQEYLQGIGNTQFAGAMELQMNTLGGSLSNLSGKFDELVIALGDAGGNGSAVWAITATSDALSVLTQAVQDLDSVLAETDIDANLGGAFERTIKSIPGINAIPLAIDALRAYQNRDQSGERQSINRSTPGFNRFQSAATVLDPITVSASGAAYGFNSPDDADAMLADYQRYQDHLQQKQAAELALNNWRRAEKQSLTDFEIYEAQRLADLEYQTQQNRQAATQNFFTNLRSLSQNAGREGFEIAKIAGIAETVINTRKAAMGAYSAMASIPYVGPALGVAAAAAAMAAGAAQIKGISSASYGGSGAVGAITGTGQGTPTSPVVTQPTSSVAQDTGALTINITGDFIGEEAWVQNKLIPLINDSGRRGVTINQGAIA